MRIKIIVLLYVVVCTIFLFIQCEQKQMTIQDKKNVVIKLIEEAGGIDLIYKDAINILESYNVPKREIHFLHQPELSQYPAIAKLGNSYSVVSETSSIDKHIEVRFGPHERTEFLYIFHPQKANDIQQNPILFEITPSIYLLLKSD